VLLFVIGSSAGMPDEPLNVAKTSEVLSHNNFQSPMNLNNSSEISRSIQLVNLSLPSFKRVCYENDEARIVFAYSDFEKNLDATVGEYMIPEDANLLSYLRDEINNTDEVDLNAIPSSELTQRAIYRVADLLEIGKAIVFDKGTGQYLRSIVIEIYCDDCGPLTGTSGRLFRTPAGKVFLKTIEEIF
jgi:hypothetical protein